MTEIFIIFGLIVLNGLFSMAEIALLSARKARLELQANKGDEDAREALELASKPDKFISTVQIGITLTALLNGIFSGDKIKTDLVVWLQKFDSLKQYSNGLATAIIVVAITYLSLVFGELLPKSIGLSNPERIAKAVSKPMRYLTAIMFPFIWLLTSSNKILIRIFNIKSKDNQVTEEEIKAIIDEGTEHGAIEESEQEIIHRVFHLGDRNITSIMTHRNDIDYINASKTTGEIRKSFDSVIHSLYPVCADDDIDKILGTVTVKDIFLAKDDEPVVNLIKTSLHIPDNNSAYQALEKFKEEKTNHCFVVDEYGSVQGMITLNDILTAIVGDIDEPDDETFEIKEREDGSFLVDAQIQFYDFLRHFERTEWIKEGDQSFDTLAGFILHEIREIPETGQKLIWQDFEFEIIDMDNKKIDKILVIVKEEIKEEE